MINRYLFIIIIYLLSPALKGQECEWLNGDGSVASNERGACIGTDDSGNVVVWGYYEQPFTLAGKNISGTNNAFLIKYDSKGSLKWATQTYAGGMNPSFLYNGLIGNIAFDAQNNIYVCGAYKNYVYIDTTGFISINNNYFSFFIAKYNSAGKPQWIRSIYDVSKDMWNASAAKLAVDAAGNVTFGFEPTENVSFSGTSTKLVSSGGGIGLVQYSSSGTFKWVKRIPFQCQFKDIGVDGDSNIYISAISDNYIGFGSGITDTVLAVLKMDRQGNPIKFTKIKHPNFPDFRCFQLAVHNNGSLGLTGGCNGTVVFENGYTIYWSYFVAFFDSSLTFKWAKPFATLRPFDLALKKSLYMCGEDGSFAKYDTLGNLLWVSPPSGSYRFLNTSVATDELDACYITGHYGDSVNIFHKRKTGSHTSLDYFSAKVVDYGIDRGNVFEGPYCAGDSIEIPFTITGHYKPGNQFIAELSDSSGNFDQPGRELGRITDTLGGIIKGTLPMFNVATGGKYRIRVVSTNPVVSSFYRFDTLRLLIYSRDTANAGPDFAVCKGKTVTLGVTGGSKWLWSPAEIMVNAKDTANRSPLVKPDSTTEFRVIISDSSGCGVTDTDYVVLTIWQKLKVKAPDTAIICKGMPLTIKAGGIGGDTANYKYTWWRSDDANKTILSTGDGLNADPDSVRKYWVKLTDGCSADSMLLTSIPLDELKLTINPDTLICKGEKALLKATATGGDSTQYKIKWIADNSGWTDSSFITAVTPDTTTVYTAILSDGCTVKPDTAMVKITMRPPLKITVNADTVICIGETAQLRATASGGLPANYAVNWKSNNSAWADNKFITTANPTITTLYTVVLKDNCTLNADSATVKITVRPPLKISASGDTTICYAGSVSLSAKASGGLASGYHVLWKENTGSWTDTNTLLIVSPALTTTYTVTLTDNCTANADSAKMLVTVLPPLAITASTSKDSICQRQSITLTASASGGKATSRNLSWAAIPGPFTSLQNPATDAPPVNSTYIATLSDNCSPTVRDTVRVTVLPKPVAGFALNPVEGCPPLQVTFKDTSAGSDSIKNIWHIMASEVYGVKTYTHEFLYPGTYSIALTVGNALGCVDVITKPNVVTVFEKPISNFTVKPDIKEVDGPVYLFNQSQKALQYLWDMGDGNTFAHSSKKDTVYTYNDSGYYYIKLVSENDKGCTDTAMQHIRIYDRLYCAIPNAFSPGNLDDLNPVFLPLCNGIKSYTLTIYNRWGQVIQHCDNCGWDGTYMEKPVATEAYMYKLFIIAESGKKETLFGIVNVIR